MPERPYHVVLYGASGFVGRQTARYFARQTSPERVRWALAGRNRQKLEAVRAEVGATVEILVADCQDRQAVDKTETPYDQSLGQIAMYRAYPPVPPSGLAKPIAIEAPASGTRSK